MNNAAAGYMNGDMGEVINLNEYTVTVKFDNGTVADVEQASWYIKGWNEKTQPWEASMVKEIEKAINCSDIGINPTNDGKLIRLVFPELTEERRKELAKDIKKKGEEASGLSMRRMLTRQMRPSREWECARASTESRGL